MCLFATHHVWNSSISKGGIKNVNKMSNISFEEFIKTGSYPLTWSKERKLDYNLHTEYPGTSIYPVSLIRLFKDKYNLESFEAYRTSDSLYPRETFLFFKRKG